MRLRIGLIGCGRWGRLILRDLLACGAQVSVVAPDPVTRQRALDLGAHSATSHISTLEEMDGFVVATPTATHAEVLRELVSTGRPIFVEKPMTADVASARELTQAADGRLFVMDKWRYHPAVEAMRMQICSGQVGEVLAIRTLRWQWGNPHKDVSALWILAPHDLAIVLHLIGYIPPFRSVRAACADRPDLGATINLRAENGPSITLDIGIASPDHVRRCLVIGTRATLELRDGYDDRLFIREGAPGAANAPESFVDVGRKMPLLAEIESFVAFVAGGPPPMSSAREGLLIVERIAEVEAALAGGAAPAS